MKAVEFPNEVTQLLAARENAKKMQDYTRADALRNELLVLGYKILDTSTGPTLERV